MVDVVRQPKILYIGNGARSDKELLGDNPFNAMVIRSEAVPPALQMRGFEAIVFENPEWNTAEFKAAMEQIYYGSGTTYKVGIGHTEEQMDAMRYSDGKVHMIVNANNQGIRRLAEFINTGVAPHPDKQR